MNYISTLLNSVGRDSEGIFPSIECVDGFSVSCQADQFAYCSPQDKNATEWKEFELGFPSAEDSLLSKYMDNYAEDPTQATYAWVPEDVVKHLLEKHGGFKRFISEGD